MRASELIEKLAHEMVAFGDVEINIIANKWITETGDITDVEYNLETFKIDIY